MSQTDLTRFRAMCGQYRWLAVFMVVSVGAILALMFLVAPGILMARGDYAGTPSLWRTEVIRALPTLFYLFAVWSIGSAMGQLAKGRLIQPTLVSALRRVGVSLGTGGLLSVFGVTNLIRIIEGGRGGWAWFDVPGMTLGMIGGALFLLAGVVEQAGHIQAELDEMV